MPLISILLIHCYRFLRNLDREIIKYLCKLSEHFRAFIGRYVYIFLWLQNSIRHNLSLHNKFIRVQNEGTGKSSWWMINPDAKTGGKSSRRRASNPDNGEIFLLLNNEKNPIENSLPRTLPKRNAHFFFKS